MFEQLSKRLETVNDNLTNISSELSNIRTAVAVQDQSVKSLWREVQNISQKLDAIPYRTSDAIKDHVQDCPARQHMTAKIHKSQSSDSIKRELAYDLADTARLKIQKEEQNGVLIPKKIIVAASGIGVLIASAIATLVMKLSEFLQ